MGIDISYLLWLQDLRNAIGGIFDEVFNMLSKISVEVIIMLPFLIYWGCDKKWGYRFMAISSVGEVLNGVIKLTACAYRPWIRSDLVQPAGDSKVAATGYSFPSGHTCRATQMYGATALWQWNKRRWLGIVCIVGIVLTGFSRNWLGVHTPQDVIVGICETVLLIWVIGLVTNAVKDNNRAIDILSVVGIGAVIAVIIYILFKPYPMDYIDGKLIVDPKTMLKDCFNGCGCLIGLLIGGYIERHFVHYEIPHGHKNLPMLAGVGVGIVFCWYTYLRKAVFYVMLGADWGGFVSTMLMMIFAVAVYPLIIRHYTKEESEIK